MPSLAIICPCYNDSHFLIQWIEKVSQQDFDEIIVVNDVSTDESLKLLFTLQTKYPKLRVIINKEKGVFNAFIAGVKASNSEYICSSACDDYPLPDYSVKMKDAILTYPIVDLYLCAAKVKRDGEYYVRGLMPFNAYIDPLYASKIISKGYGRLINVSGNVVRRDVILKCFNSNVKTGFDAMLVWYCMFSKGFVCVKDILYYYRSYPTGFGSSGRIKNIILSNKLMTDFFKKNFTISQMELFNKSGLCRSRETFIPYLATRIIFFIPSWMRRIFNRYFYSYDYRVEKL